MSDKLLIHLILGNKYQNYNRIEKKKNKCLQKTSKMSVNYKQ
jgi:hypothetical protein